jgi:hypothetical protein
MKRYDFDQYSMSWWNIRRGVPTASMFGKIITPAKGELSKQADDYIHQLIADRYDPEYGVVEDYVSAAMRNGTVMEPEARRYYEFDRDCAVEQVGFCMDDAGRFGCSPDGLVGDGGGLELKSPLAKTQIAYLIADELPAQYAPQVHGSLVVTGRKWWDFMSYVPGFPPLLIRVEPDEYTDKVRKALDDFWPRYQAALEQVRAMEGFPTRAPIEDDDPVIM